MSFPMRTEGKPTSTGLDVSKGVVAGFVVEYAEALDIAPVAVLDAVEAAGSESNGGTRSRRHGQRKVPSENLRTHNSNLVHWARPNAREVGRS